MTIKGIMVHLEETAGKFMHLLCGFLFLVMTVVSLFFTRYFVEDYSAEIPYNRIELFPLTFFAAIIIAAVIFFVGEKVTAYPEKAEFRLKILLAAVIIWSVALGTALVLLCKSGTVADQQLIKTSALRFIEGNYGRLDYGKYLYVNPHQLGITAYAEMLFRIFKTESIVPFQMANVLEITGSIYIGYQITRLLFQNLKCAVYYLLLSGTCFPLFFFGSYFYGDVLSIVFSLLAVWQMLLFLKQERKVHAFLLIISMAIAVLLRNNSLIIMVACSIVLLIKAVTKKRWFYILTVILLIAGILGSRQGLEKFYEKRSGIAINDGMPMILYVAMGMQEGDKEAGWYNGYAFYIYQDVCQYHAPSASALAQAEIKARMKEFLKDPAYALDFYWRKFTSQWNEPTYGCFIMTYATEEERSALGESLYTGKLNHMLKAFMNVYQLLVYSSVFCFLVRTRKKKYPLEFYTLLIAVIGGVLFHLLWEAKSRYVLPYFVFMLPMAAAGLYEMKEMLLHGRTKDEAAEAGR